MLTCGIFKLKKHICQIRHKSEGEPPIVKHIPVNLTAHLGHSSSHIVFVARRLLMTYPSSDQQMQVLYYQWYVDTIYTYHGKFKQWKIWKPWKISKTSFMVAMRTVFNQSSNLLYLTSGNYSYEILLFYLKCSIQKLRITLNRTQGHGNATGTVTWSKWHEHSHMTWVQWKVKWH